MAYSKDLRMRVVKAYEAGEGTMEGIAQRFYVNQKTVIDWVRRYRETGDVQVSPHGGGANLKLTDDVLSKIKNLIEEKNDRTDGEIQRLLLEKHDISISSVSVNRGARKLELSRKKKTFYDPKKNSESIKKETEEFIEVMSNIDVKDVVSVDEAGATANMARDYARSPKGERARAQRPVSPGKRLSMIGALTINGLEEGFIFEGGVGAEEFLFFVEDYLVPILRPGQVVLLDNNRFHFADGVEELICETGASVLYIPRYSPEFNPIEECWSKVKNYLKKTMAWTKEELYQAISKAFDIITKDDAIGWITHAGF